MAFAALVLVVLIGTSSFGTIHGRVVDAQTGQPIAGAVVLGVWHRIAGLPGLYHHDLVDVREVETDAEGRFALERPGSLGVDEEAVTVYKFGYVAWSNLYIFPTSESRPNSRVPGEIRLERFPKGQSHQRHISFIDGARRSGTYGLEKVPRFWNALQRELDMR